MAYLAQRVKCGDQIWPYLTLWSNAGCGGWGGGRAGQARRTARKCQEVRGAAGAAEKARRAAEELRRALGRAKVFELSKLNLN